MTCSGMPENCSNSAPETAGFDHQAFLKTLSGQPGVYRMLDKNGRVLYVGKARNLRKRVASYFTRADQSIKTRAMVAQVRAIEVTLTHTENEALILESNLIKRLKPPYNIIFRDDKSYPYIYLSAHQRFPRLSYYRGARREAGRFFGPYPSSGAVRESLDLLQKLFPVRQCEDSFYRNRTRPCLQYQIKRCSAPCVGLVSEQDYAEDVRHAVMFLEGRNNQVIDELAKRMEQAAAQLEFEQAARYRDQIAALRKVQEKQYISGSGGNLDVIAALIRDGLSCVQVFYIRDGHNLGNKTFFPRHAHAGSEAELLSAFIAQYYLGDSGHRIPGELLLNAEPADAPWLARVLAEQAGHQVRLSHRLRGERARWLELARRNAEHALNARLADKSNMLQRLAALQDVLELDEIPQRLECFDISHTRGEETVASCVVFDASGPLKSDYRRYNIEGITGGDDYAAMRQALERRYRRLKTGEGKLPEVLLIDGGRGQLRQAADVLEELQITGVTLVGVAKGETRKPGLESLFLLGRQQPLILPADAPALHLIQQIRDEAHRFAITGHRLRRGKKRARSSLEDIPGLGPKRRQQLLRQFGGLQGIARAGVEDLARVKGISRTLAQKIYDRFHAE